MLLRVGELPGQPLEAAARFYGEVLGRVQGLLQVPPLQGEVAARSADGGASPQRLHPSVAPGGSTPPLAGEGLEDLTLVFPPADHTHRAWRLAAVQELARKYAPRRVNALVSDDEAAIAAAGRYLTSAPGVTGQLLTLDGNGVE